MPVRFQAFRGLAQQRIGLCADGYDYGIHIQRKLAAFLNYRAAATALVRLAKGHFHTADASNPTFFIAQHLYGVYQCMKNDAFFLRVLHFFQSRGQFRHTAAVYDVYLFRAHPHEPGCDAV